MPERWRQIEDLYHAASERPDSEREGFLAAACGEDAAMRAEVESLLRVAGEEAGFLEGSPPGLTAESPVTLKPGDTLGSFQIVASIGRGGMGQVWKARDLRLGRNVAIKISALQFSNRFEREARSIAALNHPNICTLHDVGPNYLVMELVEGPTLAERIAQGPIPLQETLGIARQIADALEAAHDKGIIHRDLKPANVKVRPDGSVKVLDFGLAKVSGAGEMTADSPTAITGTQSGLILGTAGYMSPEQARGQTVDKRADIWAFGVVIYEMLTGKRLFDGETVSDSLAAIIKVEPDLTATPEKTRHLLQRCLEKDPRKRLRDIGDWQESLVEPVQAIPTALQATDRRRRRGAVTTLSFLAATLGIIAIAQWRKAEPGDLPLTRLRVDLGPEALTGPQITAVISPDARRLVFPSRGSNGERHLATRQLDQIQSALLPGTEGAQSPFFSPDGKWVGFAADGKLKKVSIAGGTPAIVSDAPYFWGAAWTADGNIIAALDLQAGLSLVSAADGSHRFITTPGRGEVTHRWPQILPGGETILYTASPTNIGMENAAIQATSLKSGATRRLLSNAYFGRYLPGNGTGGYLLYVHDDVLTAVRFDPRKLEIQGTPAPMVDDAAVTPFLNGGGQFDFAVSPARHGTLVYLAGKPSVLAWPVMWLDSSGNMQTLNATPGFYSQPRFSPDGNQLALTMRTGAGPDIYVYDLRRETMTRITSGGHSQQPVWTPNGKYIAFQWSAEGFGIGWIRSDGSGEARRILMRSTLTNPYSFSPDGDRLAYYGTSAATANDIGTVTVDTTDSDHPKLGQPDLFLGTPADEIAPMFSPDGRWISYRSDESGRNEVYVRPFPAGREAKWQISAGGAGGGTMYSMWSGNGRELFFERGDNRIMVVDYAVNGNSFVSGKPRVWSERQIYMPGNTNLALAPDGKRFAVFPRPEAPAPVQGSVHITFLLNFFDELHRRLPADK